MIQLPSISDTFFLSLSLSPFLSRAHGFVSTLPRTLYWLAISVSIRLADAFSPETKFDARCERGRVAPASVPSAPRRSGMRDLVHGAGNLEQSFHFAARASPSLFPRERIIAIPDVRSSYRIRISITNDPANRLGANRSGSSALSRVARAFPYSESLARIL